MLSGDQVLRMAYMEHQMFKKYVGSELTEELKTAILLEAGSAFSEINFIHYGSIVTADWKPTRLRVSIDPNTNRIRDFSAG